MVERRSPFVSELSRRGLARRRARMRRRAGLLPRLALVLGPAAAVAVVVAERATG
jgi:hypothetical protein